MTYSELIKKHGDNYIIFDSYHNGWFTFKSEDISIIINGSDINFEKILMTVKELAEISTGFGYVYFNDSLIYKYI